MRAAPVLLATALAANPSAALGDEPGSRKPFSFEIGGGGGSAGAPQILVGAGWAMVDSDPVRIELFLRAGFSENRKFHYEQPDGWAGDATLQAVSGHLELAVTRRIGSLEPYLGGGLVVVGASGTLDAVCRWESAPACAVSGVPPPIHEDVDGTSLWGASGFGGLRVALGEQFLVGGELRYIQEGRSRLRQAPIAMEVGGWTGLASLGFRFGAGAPLPKLPTVIVPPAPPVAPPRTTVGEATPRAPGPAAPPAPLPAPTECAPGEAPSIRLHTARGFLCFPDPVRGGHRCELRAALGQFVETAACEAACRGDRAACPETGNTGAACSRCVQECAEQTLVACPAETGWVDARPVCVLRAGTYGLASERAVPAACAATPSRSPSP